MTQPHLASAVLMVILALQSGYALWAHDAADPPWRWWMSLLLTILYVTVMWLEIRKGRTRSD